MLIHIISNMPKKSRSRSSKKSFIGTWGKKLALIFGAAAIGTMATQYTGINNSITSGGVGWLIGGFPVAVGALLLGMFQNGGGFNLNSLIGGTTATAATGTVYR